MINHGLRMEMRVKTGGNTEYMLLVFLVISTVLDRFR